jgi:hypothetical protein
MRPQHRKPPDNLADCVATDAVERERRIAEIAGKQLGVVSAAQLRAAGFGEGAIKRRLRAGRLHRLHRGVYLVGHVVASEGATEMAAVDGILVANGYAVIRVTWRQLVQSPEAVIARVAAALALGAGVRGAI